jgi:Carboxypeptidase regulatory-like domain
MTNNKESAMLSGTVIDAHGTPLAGAALMIAGASPSHRDIATLTNQEGQYSFRGLV